MMLRISITLEFPRRNLQALYLLVVWGNTHLHNLYSYVLAKYMMYLLDFFRVIFYSLHKMKMSFPVYL